MSELVNGYADGKQLVTLSPPTFHQVVETSCSIHGPFRQSAAGVNVVVSGKNAVEIDVIVRWACGKPGRLEEGYCRRGFVLSSVELT